MAAHAPPPPYPPPDPIERIARKLARPAPVTDWTAPALPDLIARIEARLRERGA